MWEHSVLIGIIVGAYSLLLGWLFILYINERKNRVWQVNEIYKRINAEKETMIKCRQELENKMNKLMPESEVKDFVDRTILPLKEAVDGVKQGLHDLEQSTNRIHSDLSSMRTLLQEMAKNQ